MAKRTAFPDDDFTRGELARLESTAIPVANAVEALAPSAAIDQPWAYLTADALGDEQLDLHAAESEVRARDAQQTTAGLSFPAEKARQVADAVMVSAQVARAWADRTRAALMAYARRKPDAKRWYLLWLLVLVLGDACGITLALILLGELPILAATLACATGAAAVLAGNAGAEIKRVRMARERQVQPESLPEALWPWATLFYGPQTGWPLTKAMIKVTAAIIACLAVGILGLRWSVTDALAGLTFSAFSVAIALGSLWNSYQYADEVQDIVDAAEFSARELEVRAIRQAESVTIRRHAMAESETGSIKAEYASRGEAAAHRIQAAKYTIGTRNPHVLGHGPASLPDTGTRKRGGDGS